MTKAQREAVDARMRTPQPSKPPPVCVTAMVNRPWPLAPVCAADTANASRKTPRHSQAKSRNANKMYRR